MRVPDDIYSKTFNQSCSFGTFVTALADPLIFSWIIQAHLIFPLNFIYLFIYLPTAF